MTTKLKVGQMVFVEHIGRLGNRKIENAIITKIGRKFFELDRAHLGRFYIHNLRQDGHGYEPMSDYGFYLIIFIDFYFYSIHYTP
jgi:hypothetical protein